jgi:hypothetical protein
MRRTQRYLLCGLVTVMAPIGVVTMAPQASAECIDAGGVTVCAQGQVSGPDGVARPQTPYVPYPCEFDWLCDDSDADVPVGPPGGGIDIGRPGRPGDRP